MKKNKSAEKEVSSSPLPSTPPSSYAGMDLTQGSISKTLFLFSLPIIAQMSIQPLFGIVDRIFIGHLGPLAFNAVTNAGVLMMLVINLAAGLANGCTSYIARLVGQGNYKEADNASVHAMILMLLFSGLFILAFLPFDRTFFRLLGVTIPEVMEQAHDFIKIIILGNLTIMFSLIGANILRAEGDSLTPLLLALLTVGINVILAPIFIFSPGTEFWGLQLGFFGLGIQGGSLATVISRGVGCIALIIYLWRGRNIWTFTLRHFHWHPRHMLEILRVGLPMLLVNLTSWLAALVFLRILNPHPAAVVAYGIGTQLDMLAVLPMIGLTVAMVAMVGQNFGAGKMHRAKRAAVVGGVYAAVFSGLLGLAAIIFSDFWIGLFNPGRDPEIIALSAQYIFIVGLSYTLVAQAFVLGGAFQGLGKGMPPLFITLARVLLVAIPLAVLLTPHFGPKGAWIAAAASHAAGGILAIIWLSREFRKIKIHLPPISPP